LATVSAKNLEDPVEDKLAVITQEDELEDLDDLEFDYDNDYYKDDAAVESFEPERRQLDHDGSVLTYSYYSYYNYYYSNVTYSYYSYWSYSDTYYDYSYSYYSYYYYDYYSYYDYSSYDSCSCDDYSYDSYYYYSYYDYYYSYYSYYYNYYSYSATPDHLPEKEADELSWT